MAMGTLFFVAELCDTCWWKELSTAAMWQSKEHFLSAIPMSYSTVRQQKNRPRYNHRSVGIRAGSNDCQPSAWRRNTHGDCRPGAVISPVINPPGDLIKTPFLSLGNQVLAPSPRQIKADKHQKLVFEHLWPNLLFSWVSSSAPEQAVLWSIEALPSSLMPLPASLSDLLTMNTFDLIKLYLFLLWGILLLFAQQVT